MLETELPYHHFSLRPYKSLHSVRTAEGGCQMAHRANTPLRGEMRSNSAHGGRCPPFLVMTIVTKKISWVELNLPQIKHFS